MLPGLGARLLHLEARELYGLDVGRIHAGRQAPHLRAVALHAAVGACRRCHLLLAHLLAHLLLPSAPICCCASAAAHLLPMRPICEAMPCIVAGAWTALRRRWRRGRP